MNMTDRPQVVSEHLRGRRILVLEDELLISMLLEDMLADLGCVVVGPAGNIAQAEMLAINEDIDAAILDVHIGGRTSHSVAERLHQRSIPILVASGLDDTGTLPGVAVLLRKPFGADELRAALEAIFTRSP